VIHFKYDLLDGRNQFLSALSLHYPNIVCTGREYAFYFAEGAPESVDNLHPDQILNIVLIGLRFGQPISGYSNIEVSQPRDILRRAYSRKLEQYLAPFLDTLLNLDGSRGEALALEPDHFSHPGEIVVGVVET
jgi:hypothetical protein